jgi:hypothetical protein
MDRGGAIQPIAAKSRPHGGRPPWQPIGVQPAGIPPRTEANKKDGGFNN